MTKIKFFLGFIVMLSIGWMIYFNNTSQQEESPINVKELTKDDVTIVSNNKNLNEFNTIENADTSTVYTLGLDFIPDQNEISMEEDYITPYLLLKNGSSDVIRGTYVIESGKEGNKISLVALQGLQNAKIRPRNSEEWCSSLIVPYEKNSQTEVDIEISWDSNQSQKDLFIIPLDHGMNNYHNDSFIGSARAPVFLNKPDISKELIDKQSSLIQKDLPQNRYPNARLADGDKQIIHTVFDNGKTYLTKPFTYLKLESVPYDDTISLLLIDETGKIDVLEKELQIKAGKETYVDLSKIPSILETADKKKYIFLANNFNEESLADFKAVEQNKKPFFTTFHILIELFPQQQLKK